MQHEDYPPISRVFLHVMWRRYLYHPIPGSYEYISLRAAGVFGAFRNVIYAA